MSADGTIIVGTGMSVIWQEAFRWTPEKGMVGLGDLPGGGVGSQAVDVSADGSVVVGGSSSSLGEYEAFRWTTQTGMRGLGDLPGGRTFSIALATSADGTRIVGESISDSGLEAFVWDADQGMRSAADMLTNDLGLDLSGWHLETAGITDDGDTIFGRGINPSGQLEAWVATIPEPHALQCFPLSLALTLLRW